MKTGRIPFALLIAFLATGVAIMVGFYVFGDGAR
jgi:hypothetical protein